MLTNPSTLSDTEIFKVYGPLIEFDSPKQKKAFELRCTKGLKLKIIAEKVKLDEKSVRRGISKALKRIVAYYLLHKPSPYQQVSEMQRQRRKPSKK